MRARNGGFTLIELIIVLVLIAALSAIAMPRFFDSRTFTSYFNQSELESALSWTRNRAITTQCAHEFRITTTGWFVLRDDDRDAATNNDCSSQTNQPSCAADEHFNFIYRNDDDILADLSGNAVAGSDITSGTFQRLIFTADGQLYLLTSAPSDTTTGCTSLSGVSPIPNNSSLALNGLTLTIDGTTAFVAVQ
ncbi:pilus assembly FimT family protein [Reinekea blandensis]|nr:prepilin-type N-terminal cleavage/methylation domain-containing protein [Reinekea blandensis]